MSAWETWTQAAAARLANPNLVFILKLLSFIETEVEKGQPIALSLLYRTLASHAFARVDTNYDGCLQKYNRLVRLSQILNKPSKPRLNGILRVDKGEFGVFSSLPNG